MSKPSHSELLFEETKTREEREKREQYYSRTLSRMTKEEREQYYSRMMLFNQIAFTAGSKKL